MLTSDWLQPGWAAKWIIDIRIFLANSLVPSSHLILVLKILIYVDIGWSYISYIFKNKQLIMKDAGLFQQEDFDKHE